MMTAYTIEVDDVEQALAEIAGQIDSASLQKNSVGIVTCYTDFIESGIIGELHKQFSFNIIGMTTMASANQYGYDQYALSLTVLTSDDVEFETAFSNSLDSGNYPGQIALAYTDARGRMGGDPSMVITFFPYLENLNGADMLRVLDNACKGAPIWGSIATNIATFKRCHAFHNGDSGHNSMALLLMRGPINPEFVVVSIPEKNIRENRGIITGSDGCLLMEINGLPALQYLENIGIVLLPGAPTVTPFMVYYQGASEPVALGVYNVNDDGSLFCGGEMTVGAALTVGEISAGGILTTAEEAARRVIAAGRSGGALLLPCVTRCVMLAPNLTAEMQRVANIIGGAMPYMLGYSGGEICPVKDESGVLRNRFHNFTFSACVFD
jgi:hypothetical protein